MIRRPNVIVAFALLALAMGGCSSQNDQAPSLTVTGKHPADWYLAHRQAYAQAYLKDNALQCRECHGMNLDGGIALVGCAATSCHAGGHPPRPIPHAVPYTDPTVHGPAAKVDLTYCQVCHGTLSGLGTNPRFNVPIGSLATGCEASGCHNLTNPTQASYSAAHPRPWSTHNSAGNLSNACGLCHGATLLGGAGRSCSASGCHTNMAPGIPPVAGQCVSCHGKPPASGAHAAHQAVASQANLCNACHAGAGSGTPRHGQRGFASVSTAIAPTYAAKSGTGSVTEVGGIVTCRNVSCHGGIVTPAWVGAAIDVTIQCAFCHTAGTAFQTPQYNSYYSGKHQKHLTAPISLQCWNCHDPTRLATTHFSGLDTPAFTNPPGSLFPEVNYSNGRCTPNPATGSFGVTQCHDPGDPGPFTW